MHPLQEIISLSHLCVPLCGKEIVSKLFGTYFQLIIPVRSFDLY